ncbi:probable RNA-binding protein ARP1 isoform X2 [Lotus japonicus]|uniref:probable RNA-binding protein ARP1 isoform X2 n=1 Tax=Lotus japonicus TaxID=34305 RepID=UPI002583247E|nr:probable RNA-binding protein ARP1 isoform X2 [Lotus japonicus]
MTMLSTNNNNNKVGQFGDTTLTKVFVGGLAWETPKEILREQFDKFGEILEAVIISDKLTGRSKGYGFVTFKEAEAAKKACEEPTLIINGRRANCNLASLGARRPRSSPIPSPSQTPPPPQAQLATRQVQWYYPPAVAPAASPYHHQPLPFYGYPHTYIAAPGDMNYNYNYNQKLSYGNGGGYYGHQVYPVPMYYQHHHHPAVYHHRATETMGLPAHMFHFATMAPATAQVGTGTECFKRVV